MSMDLYGDFIADRFRASLFAYLVLLIVFPRIFSTPD